MSIKEKVTHQDLALYEIMRNPVLFGEFVYNYDKLSREERFEFTDYQREMLCDFNEFESLCTARAVGKTVSLTTLILWALIFNIFPSDYVVFTTPARVHLEPVWNNLIRFFRSNSFLKHFIAPNAGINSSEFSIKLLNQAMLICRIAGQSGTGQNLIGLHSSLILVDEAGYFPWNAFQEMQPSLNTWISGHREIVAGVPTGLREHNVLYHTDQENSNYTKHRVSADKNPRNTERDRIKALEQYGGEESDDFIHYWLGLHGKPIFALFDRSLMDIQNYPVYKLSLDGLNIGENLYSYVEKIKIMPGLSDKRDQCILGIDLGYTEPTAIVILQVDAHGRMKFHGRIQLTKVSYPIQEKIIDLLDDKFNPIILGIDKGAAGMSVLQHLHEDEEYLHKEYKKRLIPVDFSSSLILGIDSEGQDIKSKTKPFATSVLQDYANNHKIIFSTTDLEMITELERMTYSKTTTGEIVYKTLTIRGGKKGEDHFTSALLCGTLAYYLNNDFIFGKKERKKLAKPSWFINLGFNYGR